MACGSGRGINPTAEPLDSHILQILKRKTLTCRGRPRRMLAAAWRHTRPGRGACQWLGTAALVWSLVGLGEAQPTPPGSQTAGGLEVPPITVEAEPVPGSTSAPELYRLETVVPQVRDTRDAFERQPNDRASDVIGRMPGVVISGPPGEKKAVNLRGLGPDFNRIEVNGVQLPSSSQSRSFELMNLPAFLVQDIAIIRNPSAEYEGDGIAGRIAVTTRSIPHAPTLEVRGAFGGVNDQWQEHRQASLGYGQRLYNRFGFMGAVNCDRRLILKVKDFSELTFSGGPGG